MPDSQTPKASEDLPSVSIIVTTHNRQRSLDLLMESLLCLEYPRGLFEVIVVDDGSEPAATISDVELRCRLIHQKQRGPAAGRNAGIQAASNEFIAITDDDCRPRPSWLREMSAAYRANPHALVGGHTRNALTGNIYATASQALIHYLYESLLKHSPANSFFTTSNSGGARSSFLKIEGFDESFPLPAAEDRDISDRWKRIGPLVYVPDAVVDHYHQMTFSSFTRQHFRYGRGARLLHGRRSARAAPRSVEGVSFYWNLLAFPFRSNSIVTAVRISALFVVAQISTIAGYVREATSDSRLRE